LDEIIKFINSLPVVFVYIIPGVIFIKIHCWICCKKIYRDNHLVFSGIIISFVFVSILNLFIKNNYVLLSSASIISAIIVSIAFSFIYKSKVFEKVIQKIGINKTVNISMWDEIMDDRNVYLKLFIPGDNVYYYGLYKGHEEKVNDLYVLITDYEVRDYSDNLIADYTGNRTRWATINTKNISRVEIIYSKYSERNKKVIKNKK